MGFPTHFADTDPVFQSDQQLVDSPKGPWRRGVQRKRSRRPEAEPLVILDVSNQFLLMSTLD